MLPLSIGLLVMFYFFKGEDPVQDQLLDARPATESAAGGQDDPRPEGQDQGGEVKDVWHTFGTPGVDGYQVLMSRYGAGVRAIVMNDHYVDLQAFRKADRTREDYYTLVGEYENRGHYGLILQQGRRGKKMKKFIDGSHNQLWQVEANVNELRFWLDLEDGLVLEKVLRYQEGRHDLELLINLRHKADANSDDDKPNHYLLKLRGVELWNPREDQLQTFGNTAVAIGHMATLKGDEVMDATLAAKDLADLRSPKELIRPGAKFGFDFAGTTNRFFAGLLYAQDEDSVDAITSVNGDARPDQEKLVSGKWTIQRQSVPQLYYDLKLPVPPPGETASLRYRLYLGPKSAASFDEVPEEYGRFDSLMDQELQPPCCGIWGVSYLAKGLIWVLGAFYALVGNWGVAIIMLTFLVRGIMFPLNFRMQKTMRGHSSKMAGLKPQMDAMQKKYKSDPKKLQMEMMKFQREHKLLTAPLKGCAPILLTMPVWFGLFTALRVMYELRHQPFVGWIDDLSRPDQLFELGFAWVPYFNLLPIIMVALWLLLQMSTPLPKDPQQRQMMVMMRFMPVMMGIFLYNYAAGLMIYMCTSSVWGLIEQRITKKILGPVDPNAGGVAMTPMM